MEICTFFRPQIDAKYRKKFEDIIRHRSRTGQQGDEEPPKATPCPFCSNPVSEAELYCAHCKSALPYCVATGYHVVATDLALCGNCSFPGFRSELLKLAQSGRDCPMCGATLQEDQLQQATPKQLNRGGNDRENEDFNGGSSRGGSASSNETSE